MSDIYKKLMLDIEKKAQKRQLSREKASGHLSVERIVFDFFRNAEESRAIHNNESYDVSLLKNAFRSMEERLRVIDSHVKIAVEWETDKKLVSPSNNLIRGVTITWSATYLNGKNIYPTLYIDVGQMLFL